MKQYIEQNKDRFLEELFSLIRIPSISSEQEHKPDMVRCAERWKELLLEAGADRAEVMPTDGNPVVYGEKTIDPKKPTVLVYGHSTSGLAVPTTTKVRVLCTPRLLSIW